MNEERLSQDVQYRLEQLVRAINARIANGVATLADKYALDQIINVLEVYGELTEASCEE